MGGYGVIYGIATATDTLSSQVNIECIVTGMYVVNSYVIQAYGAENYRRVGIILQRSILICLLASFPVIVVFLNTESVLLILHQSPCVAR